LPFFRKILKKCFILARNQPLQNWWGFKSETVIHQAREECRKKSTEAKDDSKI
jgi:hypothetical protein